MRAGLQNVGHQTGLTFTRLLFTNNKKKRRHDKIKAGRTELGLIAEFRVCVSESCLPSLLLLQYYPQVLPITSGRKKSKIKWCLLFFFLHFIKIFSVFMSHSHVFMFNHSFLIKGQKGKKEKIMCCADHIMQLRLVRSESCFRFSCVFGAQALTWKISCTHPKNKQQ